MGHITFKLGDITLEEVDAIVNAANESLLGGGGVDGAIHSAGGPAILEECIKIGGCKTGQAVITNGGELKAKKIIHTVGPVWRGGLHNEAGLLKDAYHNSFLLAKKENIKTIAFPAISTGVYGYPAREAAKIAIKTGIKFQDDFADIRYVLFSEKFLCIYKEVYKEEIVHE